MADILKEAGSKRLFAGAAPAIAFICLLRRQDTGAVRAKGEGKVFFGLPKLIPYGKNTCLTIIATEIKSLRDTR